MPRKKEKKYVLDQRNFSVGQATVSVWKVVRTILLFLLLGFTCTVLVYAAISLVFNTEEEKALKTENRIYEKNYSDIVSRAELIEDVVEGLQYKDNKIYKEVFNASAPSVDPINSLSFLFGNDTIPDEKIWTYSNVKLDQLGRQAALIEENFRAILLSSAGENKVFPPMTIPVEKISYPQIGAGQGKKLSPFLKAYVQHSGVDFIAPQGDPVFASAGGVVADVVKSKKGQGNTVVIEHSGGYQTRYCHLLEIVVRRGQVVERGRKIGTVGMSGAAFAPHLHYEVLKDGINMNPMNYIFASLPPYEYANMLYMSINTEQSMD